MSEPLVLVILLAAGPADPTADAMMGATRKALGPEAIVLADFSMPVTDGDALQLATKVGARAVARVTWADAAQLSAHLHVHVAPAPATEWADDDLTFQRRDAASEKGRTVGYTLATMVQRIERDRAAAAASGGPNANGAPAEPNEPKNEHGASPAPTKLSQDASPPTPPSPPRSPRRGDFDLFATVSGALGGAASSLGAGGGVRLWPTDHLGVRLAALGRWGSVSGLPSTTLGAAAGPGFRVRLASSRLEIGARADIAVFHHAVRKEGLTRSRYLGGVDLVLEGAWRVSSDLAFVLGFGGELAFGTTDVHVGGVRVAEFPAIRGIAEVGGRFRF